MASVTGPVGKIQSDPKGFSIQTSAGPPPVLIPFPDCTADQYALAVAAWGAGKNLKVTFPDGGGAATNVENA